MRLTGIPKGRACGGRRWHDQSRTLAHPCTPDSAAGEGHARNQGEHLAVERAHIAIVSVAGRIWRVQCQLLAAGRSDAIHYQPDGASSETELRRRIHCVVAKIRNRIRPAICFWVRLSSLTGTPDSVSHTYPAFRPPRRTSCWARLWPPLRGVAARTNIPFVVIANQVVTCRQFRSDGATAGPSTPLRFGRDDTR